MPDYLVQQHKGRYWKWNFWQNLISKSFSSSFSPQVVLQIFKQYLVGGGYKASADDQVGDDQVKNYQLEDDQNADDEVEDDQVEQDQVKMIKLKKMIK